jgi:hypothetical protein
VIGQARGFGAHGAEDGLTRCTPAQEVDVIGPGDPDEEV